MAQPREGSVDKQEGVNQMAQSLWQAYETIEVITTQLKALQRDLCRLQIEVVKLKGQMERSAPNQRHQQRPPPPQHQMPRYPKKNNQHFNNCNCAQCQHQRKGY